MTTRPDIKIPRPHIANGPQGVPEDKADVDYLRKAATELEGYIRPFGSTLRATIVKLVRDAADAIESPSSPTPASAQTPVRVRQLLRDLIDTEDCWFDHNGGCQAHGYISLQPGEECPHSEAKRVLADTEETEDE